MRIGKACYTEIIFNRYGEDCSPKNSGDLFGKERLATTIELNVARSGLCDLCPEQSEGKAISNTPERDSLSR
jgi:hypothetical protein